MHVGRFGADGRHSAAESEHAGHRRAGRQGGGQRHSDRQHRQAEAHRAHPRVDWRLNEGEDEQDDRQQQTRRPGGSHPGRVAGVHQDDGKRQRSDANHDDTEHENGIGDPEHGRHAAEPPAHQTGGVGRAGTDGDHHPGQVVDPVGPVGG